MMQSLEAVQQSISEHPWRAGALAFGAVLASAVVLFGVDYVLRPQSFPVRSIRFSGEFRHVDEKALTAAIMDSVRGNFFLLDLDAVRERARSVPWVYDATVRRLWPDGVQVAFSEQQLVARWGQSGWVNVQGDYVDLKGQPGPDGLPQLVGPEGMQDRLLEHYRRLSEILAPANLHVASLALTPRHSWNMVLDNGLVLTLGREEPEPKVARFARVYPLALAAQAAKIRRVDLRYTNGFAVQWVNPANAPRASEIVVTGSKEG
jgi:cell division protein FtsQ